MNIIIKPVRGIERAEREKPPYGRVFPPRRDSEAARFPSPAPFYALALYTISSCFLKILKAK